MHLVFVFCHDEKAPLPSRWDSQQTGIETRCLEHLVSMLPDEMRESCTLGCVKAQAEVSAIGLEHISWLRIAVTENC